MDKDRYSSFSVNKFNSELQNNGVFRPYHFLVLITPPSHKYVQEIFNQESMSLRIESTTLPARSLQTIDQNYYGPMRRIPYRYNSVPLRMSVIMSEDTRERELFSRWQDMLVGRSRFAGARSGEGNFSRNQFNSHYYDDAAKNCSIDILAFAESAKFQGDSNRTFFNEVSDIATAFGFDPSVPTAAVGLSGLFPGIRTQKVEPVLSIHFHEAYPIDVQEMNLDWGESNSYGKLQLQFNYRYYSEEYAYEQKGSSPDSFASDIRKSLNLFRNVKDVVGVVNRQGVSGTLNQITRNFGNFRL